MDGDTMAGKFLSGEAANYAIRLFVQRAGTNAPNRYVSTQAWAASKSIQYITR
jgi:hypothetical protein